MYCDKCGAKNEDNAWKCTQCNQALTHVPDSISSTIKVPNYLAQSILVTLCCCVFLGIPAIVFAAAVNSKLAAGDIDGAKTASQKAKMWCWIAFGCGLVANLIYLTLNVISLIAKSGTLPAQ